MADEPSRESAMPARTLRRLVSDAVWDWQQTNGVPLGVREQDALVELMVTRIGEMLAAKESLNG
jgi:hypothetical protein